MAGDGRNDVKKENLIDELINTGKFTEEEVAVYLKRAQKYGFIFERKTDVYSSVVVFAKLLIIRRPFYLRRTTVRICKTYLDVMPTEFELMSQFAIISAYHSLP